MSSCNLVITRILLAGNVARYSNFGTSLKYLLATFMLSVSRPILGPTQPHLQWVPGAPFLGVKRPGREADHSPPSSAEVNSWSSTFTPPIRLHGVVLS
jgi:hypothetical protein